MLTDLALATYPDGSTPDVMAVVRTSTFLFAAGQETTARLLASALKQLALHPELQGELRAVHLNAHVATVGILQPAQVARYDGLRGYTTAPAASQP